MFFESFEQFIDEEKCKPLCTLMSTEGHTTRASAALSHSVAVISAQEAKVIDKSIGLTMEDRP